MTNRAIPDTELDALIAGALGASPTSISEATEFRGIPEWDSLGHVELMLALEEYLGVEIGPDQMTQLTSVASIRRFARGPSVEPAPLSAQATDPVLHRGLSGVLLDETLVSRIDGEAGSLSYRGYSIDDLVRHSTFEESAYLLVHGALPTQAELDAFGATLEQAWEVPATVERVLHEMRDARPIDALRTAVSALGAIETTNGQPGPLLSTGIELIGRTAALVAAHHALRHGQRPDPEPGAGHAAKLLSVLIGRRPSPSEARIFDRCLILLAEHGSNASAFAGRVAIGTHADLYAALTAAIATFAGPLHGGAVEAVAGMIEQIGEPQRAAGWVRSQRAGRVPVFGFGHRIYRTEDPRAPHLRRMAQELAQTPEEHRALEILEALRHSMRDHARHGVDVNVDLYAGLVFASLGVPVALYMPIFAASRTAGWVAHALEQHRRNVLIRPSLRYAGETARQYVPVGERVRASIAPVAVAATPAAAEARLHTGFLARGSETPSAPALRIGDATWTYEQLETVARRWAGAISASLGRQPARICVFGARSEVSYGGVLASLFAGAAFVPLSPDMPVARSRQMLIAAQPDALLVDRNALPLLDGLLDGVEAPLLLLPDADRSAAPPGCIVRDQADLRRAAPLADLPAVERNQVAYLLFTSGSTGVPKGVPISHANAVSFLESAQRRYGLSQDDRLSQTFQQTFDLSIFDLFMAWSSGACLCVPEPIDLVAPFGYVRRQGITVWFSVPSLATLLQRKDLLKPNSLPGLRWSLFCGEALPVATAEAWQAAAPNSIVENLYGPTECTIACTVYRWDPQRTPGEAVNGLVPIGRPLPGVRALVVDEEEAPVPAGVPGELLIGGAQTFDGYWHNPEATERAFHQRLYRTGDRVMTLASGDLAFLGRRDHQVQVMGHRVELGEVEAALRTWPGVDEAIVLPWRPAAGSAEGLTAVVAGTGIDTHSLTAQMQERLPAYMAPRTIHVVAEFPLNSNGKVDRGTLAALLDD